MDFFERVKKVTCNTLKLNEEDVKPDSSFSELRLDSLDTVELIMAVEKEFGIKIDDEKAEKITSLSELVDFIEKEGGK